jgi:hypothetical protein
MQIFISYAHKDKDWLTRIYPDIAHVANQFEGSRIWTDERIQPGQRWDEEIRMEIARADLFIILGSVEYVVSRYIHETERPLILRAENEHRLIPILISTLEGAQAKELRAFQWIPGLECGLAGLEHDRTKFDRARFRIMDAIEARLKNLSKTRLATIQPAPIDRASPLNDLNDTADSPTVRLDVKQVGPDQYRAELEIHGVTEHTTRAPVADLTKPDTAQINGMLQHPNPSALLAKAMRKAQNKGLPVRLQLTMPRGARSLIELPWEQIPIGQYQLGRSPEICFSRHLSFDDAEPESFNIQLRNKVSGLRIQLLAAPVDDAHRAWISSVQTASRPKFDENEFEDFTIAPGDPIEPKSFENSIWSHEIILIEGMIGLPNAQTTGFSISVPDQQNPGKVSAITMGDFSQNVLRSSGPVPALFILAPYSQSSNDICRRLGIELAAHGASSVIVPQGDFDSDSWSRVVTALLNELATHGQVDLACQKVNCLHLNGQNQLVLYLRARSARLWYTAGFRRSPKHENDKQIWDEMRQGLVDGRLKRDADGRLNPDGEEAIPLIALVGGGFDERLKYSRRDIAESLADKYGFSLSSRERQDLSLVADYIQTQKKGREHIQAFLQKVQHRLAQAMQLRRGVVMPHDLIDASLQVAKSTEAWKSFEELAQLRASCFITSYFHHLISQALDASGRTPIVARALGNHNEQVAEQSPSVERPLVYHLIGDFSNEQSIALSRTDYLDVLDEFYMARNPYTKKIQRFLSFGALIFLGFSPAGGDLRLLLNIIRRIETRHASSHLPHVAVQIDPEDDHTIDAIGARDYYAGLLSRVGPSARIYWGDAQSFLKQLRKEVPECFQTKV